MFYIVRNMCLNVCASMIANVTVKALAILDVAIGISVCKHGYTTLTCECRRDCGRTCVWLCDRCDYCCLTACASVDTYNTYKSDARTYVKTRRKTSDVDTM